MITLQDVQRGYDAWAAKPHNAKWVRKIDGTPIANDIIVNIFEALKDGGQEVEAVAKVTGVSEYGHEVEWLDDGAIHAGSLLYLRPQPASTALVERPQVLKGVGKINGDGWKDTTKVGEVVFVWNEELPPPYKPGQFPRIGCEHYTASTDQYDFTPASISDIRAYLNAAKEGFQS